MDCLSARAWFLAFLRFAPAVFSPIRLVLKSVYFRDTDERRGSSHVQQLLVRSNRRWLEILDQATPPVDDLELLAIWEELRSILAKYDTGNLKAA